MRKLRFLLLVGATAAGVAYFLHPEHGPERRDRARRWLEDRLASSAAWSDEEVALEGTTISETSETVTTSRQS